MIEIAFVDVHFATIAAENLIGKKGTVMRSPQVFRSHAVECMRLAQEARDPEHRSLLLVMARSWAVLAESAEKIEVFLTERECRTH